MEMNRFESAGRVTLGAFRGTGFQPVKKAELPQMAPLEEDDVGPTGWKPVPQTGWKPVPQITEQHWRDARAPREKLCSRSFVIT
jgi:hypothetical protein